MFVIGIVGGIGSGKSMIADTIGNLYNTYILEADKIGHEVMLSDGPAFNEIIEIFGDAILDESGEINRKLLAELVYQDDELLNQLNMIIHREVFIYLRNHVDYLRENPIYDFVVIEAALLIVDQFIPLIDSLWYIKSDEKIRTQRLTESRHMSINQIQTIMSKQPEASFYERYAQVVISNNTDFLACIEVVNNEINKLWRKYND